MTCYDNLLLLLLLLLLLFDTNDSKLEANNSSEFEIGNSWKNFQFKGVSTWNGHNNTDNNKWEEPKTAGEKGVTFDTMTFHTLSSSYVELAANWSSKAHLQSERTTDELFPSSFLLSFAFKTLKADAMILRAAFVLRRNNGGSRAEVGRDNDGGKDSSRGKNHCNVESVLLLTLRNGSMRLYLASSTPARGKNALKKSSSSSSGYKQSYLKPLIHIGRGLISFEYNFI